MGKPESQRKRLAATQQQRSHKVTERIVPRMVDNVYKSSPLLTRLRTRNAERFEGGTSIRHPIMYAELRGGAFTRGGTFDISYIQTDTSLEILVKYLGLTDAVEADRLSVN